MAIVQQERIACCDDSREIGVRRRDASRLADEVTEAELNRPETLAAAFKGAYGVFLVTTSSLEGTDERKQGAAAVQAARDAGVKHVVWSTLPDVEAISGGKFHVPHFTSKAKVDPIVKDAGFANHTFVIAPVFYQNLAGAMAPQQQAEIHGLGAPARSERALHSHGIFANSAPSSLSLRTRIRLAMASICFVGDFTSFNEIVDVLNRQGHNFSFTQAPPTSSPLSFLELRRSPRCLGTSKFIPTWVRIRPTELRSQTE
jgi:hypothetical protein